MKKLPKLIGLVFCICLFISCTQDVELDISSVDLSDYTAKDKREAFMEVVWGDVPGVGHLTTTPWPNITFERTIAYSFDDVFYFTLAVFQHHPYLTGSEDVMDVYIAPDAMFNLLNLPGRFEYVRRETDGNGMHIVSGFHNGTPFEIEFEEESHD